MMRGICGEVTIRGGCGAGKFCTTRRWVLPADRRGSVVAAVGTMDPSGAGTAELSGSTALWTSAADSLLAETTRGGLCGDSLLAETATNTPTTIAAVAEATKIAGRCRASMGSSQRLITLRYSQRPVKIGQAWFWHRPAARQPLRHGVQCAGYAFDCSYIRLLAAAAVERGRRRG